MATYNLNFQQRSHVEEYIKLLERAREQLPLEHIEDYKQELQSKIVLENESLRLTKVNGKWTVNLLELRDKARAQPVTLVVNVANLSPYSSDTYIGFIRIEIDKYVFLGLDYAFTSISYSLTLFPGESTLLALTFTPDETTSSGLYQSCRHYYYKVYTCFSCIHQPTDADTRECLYVLPRILPSDLNGDGKVNLNDLIILAAAFGSKPGDPNWNAVADINGNGKVDLIDLITLATNYGKTV